jgi:hypothetical protein
MRFNARFDTSFHGPQHPFKDAGVVVTSSIFTADASGQKRILMNPIETSAAVKH